MRVLLTGIAGSGKTTAMRALGEAGYRALDLDDCNVCTYVNKETGEPAVYTEGDGGAWIARHRWVVIVPKLVALLDTFPKDEIVFMGGKFAKGQAAELAQVFDHIFLLQPPDAVIDHRLATRTSNAKNFGRQEDERTGIIQSRAPFEETCLAAGATLLTNDGTIDELVTAILSEIKAV